ncbi:hypothetical protein Acr_14g0008930 [Actinidia rufa]|uniref:Uncharacterized protein n=1 Tax=Actinidia rufa TaxID=165716 RepID=A0A7J0FTJ6_9ERIC|nr:hypothetical protein Acr_14g0008930 [Actinidia rufa]
MDTSSPFVDPYPNRSSVDSIGLIAVTSVGDSAAEASSSLLFESDSTNSDESDIILASSRPKKKAGRKEVQGDEAPGVQRSEEEEYRQVGLRALALKGRSACLNFADSVWRLPVPDSTDSNDIRQAATAAAEVFRPAPEGSIEVAEDVKREAENVCVIDEEAIFDMRGFALDMAEQPLHSPPPWLGRDFSWDDGESDIEVSLWSY